MTTKTAFKYRQNNKVFPRVLFVGIVITSATLLSCRQDRGHPTSEDQSGLDHADQTILLSKDDIVSIKPELYQPSYNLYGQLIPVEQHQLQAVQDALVSDVFVAEGDWVTIDQPLMKLRLNANPSYSNSNNTDLDVINSDGDGIEKRQLEEAQAKDTPNKSIPHSHDDIDDDHDDIDDDDNDKNESSVDMRDVAVATEQTTPVTTNQPQTDTYVTLMAPSAGEVTNILVKLGDNVKADQPVLILADTTHLQLIGELPLVTKAPDNEGATIDTESQLSIGQAVNFTVYDVHQDFTGQISAMNPSIDGDMLTVQALVNQSEDTKTELDVGMQATMSVNYGQAELSVRLPRSGIQDVDLSGLDKTHTRPVRPLHGYVWIIGQDHRLSRQPIDVVEFFPQRDQFLVVGISNDSLVSLVDLPIDKDGSLVKIQ